ncbi:hypothetical protein CLV47_1222 [Antricoccus suffuscus]|uniref:THUMP-like domain-containing protein n=1 Tax=Antricoccus suffuscus TaxID=1629062 RepID=A0A2T0ZFP9_9ACTN|nr:SAM-dependent methyltransferase [Antricoccus suffuscus]PRZ35182.1 hypothetical protein CLV47_1222 [Antricoccus suffuscus]
MPAPHELGRLTSDAGAFALAAATRMIEDGQSDLQMLQSLRRTVTQDTATAALRQAQLRRRAVAKFGDDAAQMWFLPDSLEQASRPEVSAHRVGRLVDAGVRRIVDAGAGIGGDTIAFARAGIDVTAIESDPAVSEALRLNVAALGLGGLVEVVPTAAREALRGVDARTVLFFDPARRTDGRRVFDPQLCSPPLSWITSFTNPVVAKMSPGLDHDAVPDGWEAEWVSTATESGRSVVEACLWSPPFAAAECRATVVGRNTVESIAGRPDDDLPVGEVSSYVYEPDGAVNQAHLVGQVVRATGGTLLQPKIAYVTGDSPLPSTLASTYQVLEVLNWSKRRVKAAMRNYSARDLIVKMRGLRLDPGAVRRELLPALHDQAGEPIVLILCRRTSDTIAILARRVAT